MLARTPTTKTRGRYRCIPPAQMDTPYSKYSEGIPEDPQVESKWHGLCRNEHFFPLTPQALYPCTYVLNTKGVDSYCFLQGLTWLPTPDLDSLQPLNPSLPQTLPFRPAFASASLSLSPSLFLSPCPCSFAFYYRRSRVPLLLLQPCCLLSAGIA